MTILDLFCGSGGAAFGLLRAGWHVVGIDKDPKPGYPGSGIVGDALEMPWPLVDAIYAAPPLMIGGRMSAEILVPRLVARGLPFIFETAYPYQGPQVLELWPSMLTPFEGAPARFMTNWPLPLAPVRQFGLPMLRQSAFPSLQKILDRGQRAQATLPEFSEFLGRALLAFLSQRSGRSFTA